MNFVLFLLYVLYNIVHVHVCMLRCRIDWNYSFYSNLTKSFAPSISKLLCISVQNDFEVNYKFPKKIKPLKSLVNFWVEATTETIAQQPN